MNYLETFCYKQKRGDKNKAQIFDDFFTENRVFELNAQKNGKSSGRNLLSRLFCRLSLFDDYFDQPHIWSTDK